MKKVEDYIASGILEQFVLGTLPVSEARQVEEMAARHPAVRQEIVLIEETLFGMAENLAVQPSGKVLSGIHDHIAAEESLPAKTTGNGKTKRKLRYGIAATFTLKLVAMAVAANFWIHWQRTESKLDGMEKRYHHLEQQAQQMGQALLAISDPATQTVVLRGQAPKSDTRVPVYWNQKTQEVWVNLANLPQTAPDQQFQLWGLVDGNAVNLGLMNHQPGEALPQIVPFKRVTGLTGLAISLEPAGGSKAPSAGQIYFQGEIN